MTSWQTKEARPYDRYFTHDQTAYVKRLIRYIKDDSTVAVHARREFGNDWSAADVASVRKRQPREYVRKVEPLATTESTQWAQAADLGSRRLRDRMLGAARGA